MRRRKAIYNIISYTILQIVTILFGLIIPKMIIENYGSDTNGLVSSIRQFVSAISIVEFGLGQVAIYALYKPLAQKDYESVGGILSATKSFYNQCGIIFLILLSALAIIYPVITKNNFPHWYVLILVLLIGASSLMEFFIIGKYRVLIRADNNEYFISLIQFIIIFLNLIISFVLIKFKVDILIINAVNVILYCIRPIVYKAYVKSKYKYIDFMAVPNKNALNQRWASFTHQISGMIMNNVDVFMITTIFSLQFVSVYTIYAYIFNALRTVLGIFTNGLSSGFGNVIAKKESNVLHKSYNVLEVFLYNISAVVYSTTFIVILPFMRLYTSNFSDSSSYIIYEMALLFVVAQYINEIRVPSNILVIAAGLFEETKYRAIIEMSLNIVFSLIGVKILGFFGVLLGTIVALFYRSIDFVIFSSKRILKRDPLISFRNILPSIISLILCMIIFKSYIEYIPDGYLNWIIFSAIIFTLISLITFIINVAINYKNIMDALKYALNKKIYKSKETKSM